MKNTTLNKIWILAAIILICLLFPPTSHAAYAATGGPGRISGQLVNGTHQNVPVPDQTVTLQMAQGQTTQDLTTQKTDAHGQFSFTNLATDKTISYAVYLKFQGAQYTSDILTLDSKPQQQTQLVIYDATTDSSKLAIVESTVLIQQPDPQNNLMTVSEIVAFRNLDTRTYVGSLDASKGKPNALLFALPPNVRQVSLDKGFAGYQQILVDTGFAANAAVPPGASEFGFSFQVAPTTASYEFPYRATYPTVDLSILVPPGIHASSGSLASQGTVNANQSTYQLFKTSTLRAGDQVYLNLDGLPVSAPAANQTPPPPNTALIGLVISLVLMLIVLFATWKALQVRQRRLRAARSKSSVQLSKRSGTTAPVKPAAMKPDERQEELLAELLELDKTFEAGTISKSTYQEKRAKLKARLRSLMREQETSRR
jgi:5-hydroxyisourate hydrolase-like protein (transthyretin family)